MRTWVIFNTKMQALPAATLLPRITGQENLVEGAAFRRVVTTEGREVGTGWSEGDTARNARAQPGREGAPRVGGTPPCRRKSV